MIFFLKFNLLLKMKKLFFLLLFLLSTNLACAQLYAPEIKVQNIVGNGIGIKTLPSANVDLHIKDSRASLFIENTSTSNWSYLRIKGSGSNFFDIAQYGNNDYLEFRPMGQSTNRMLFKKDGTLQVKSIGIKTLPNAYADLHIKDSYASLFIENTSSNKWSYLRIKGSGSNFFDIAQYGNNDYLEFRPMGQNTNRMLFKKDGTLIATTFQAINPPWSDFVFKPGYNLRSLEDLEQYIAQNKHLPEIPKEDEVQEKGINLGEMNAKLLQKIEELTLYVIDLNKRMKKLEHENTKLKKGITTKKPTLNVK